MSRKQVEFEEMQEEVIVTLRTMCPEKYLLVDRENGNVFVAKETGEWELIRGR